MVYRTNLNLFEEIQLKKIIKQDCFDTDFLYLKWLFWHDIYKNKFKTFNNFLKYILKNKTTELKE